MAGPSLMAELLEQEERSARRAAAQKVWVAEGHPGDMSIEWQELYEFTLLSHKKKLAAIDFKIKKNKEWQKNAEFMAKKVSEEVKVLRDEQTRLIGVPQPVEINLNQKQIEAVLLEYYTSLAERIGKEAVLEITMSADPITDNIWCAIEGTQEAKK